MEFHNGQEKHSNFKENNDNISPVLNDRGLKGINLCANR